MRLKQNLSKLHLLKLNLLKKKPMKKEEIDFDFEKLTKDVLIYNINAFS